MSVVDSPFNKELLSIPHYGEFTIYQRSRSEQNDKSLAINSTSSDSTGSRTYLGCYVALKLLNYLSTTSFKSRISEKSLIELGCGTGLLSLLSHLKMKYKRILLTDGNPEAIEMSLLNTSSIHPTIEISRRIASTSLIWGLNKIEMNHFKHTWNEGFDFDLVLASELMYYKTDLNLLISTVINLVNPLKGLFIHAHLFRVPNQERKMIEIMKTFEWTSFIIPIKHFLTPQEIKDDPMSLNVKCLISGHSKVIQEFSEEMNFISKDWLDLEDYLNEIEIEEAKEEEESFMKISF